MRSNCSSEVFTPTGKFTFHAEEVTMCEAKKICARNDEILAPITNQQDFDAIVEVAKAGNHPNCSLHHGDHRYIIGLDITSCGRGKQQRVFTNGVVWDEDVHGKLYADRWDVRRSNCAYAELATWGERPWLEVPTKSCYQDSHRFLCLKPSTALKANAESDTCSFKPQAIKSNNKLNFASAAIIGFCGVASVFFAFVAVKYYKKYRSVKEKHGQVKASSQ